MPDNIIINLLHNLGTRREVDRYIREFTAPGAPAYAVVKVGGALIEDDLDELASSLALLRQVGMSPVVVHGAGPQLSRELERQGVTPQWVDGLRVTDHLTLSAAHRVFVREGARLAAAIDGHGARARPIPTGVFHATAMSPERLGLVGRVQNVDLEPIRAAIESGYIPILSPLAASAGGQILNVNADDATRAVAAALQPRKIIFLTGTAGLLDPQGSVIPAINLADDRERLVREGWVSGGMARKLEEIADLLEVLPDHSSVSITAPAHVARELFTYKGSGTLVRKGVAIREHRGLEKIDAERLRSLLERSFDKPLLPGFFEKVAGERIFLAGDYTAAAIVTDDGPAAYLDKFAVTAEAQGSGIGASLWNRLTELNPRLFWRSHESNASNTWYTTRADGMRRCGEWLVFWRGIGAWEEIEACVAYALGREPSFTYGSRPDGGPEEKADEKVASGKAGKEVAHA